MTTSYRPCNGPLSDEELAEIVRRDFERNKDDLEGKGSK